MQHFPSAAPPIRTASSAQYGVATPTGPGECKKAQSRLPVAGRIAHAPAGPPVGAPHPGQVAVAAPAPAPAPAGAKMPQLQHLPRFQPPSFEGANGTLPCPDSPGSTPRDDEPDFMDAAAPPHPGDRSGERWPAEHRLGEVSRSQEVVSRDEELHPPAPSRGSRHQPEAQAVAEPPPQAPTPPARTGPHPPGSFVEYKSRSSGLWILAKVEGYDESSQTYRLDVQPHAQAERVRPRGGGAAPNPSAEPSSEPDRPSRSRDDREMQKQPTNHHGHVPVETGLLSNPSASGSKDHKHGNPATPQAEHKDLGKRSSSEHVVDAADFGEADVSASRWQLETESLRKQVARLQSENEGLHERLMHESALKDHYFSELCLFREQMQRVRSTPR